MADKIICDICEIKEANTRIKAKKSNKIRKIGNYLNSFWSRYENIDMCNTCYEKLFKQKLNNNELDIELKTGVKQ